MSKVVIGSIPKKISYVSSEEKEVAIGCEWDIDWTENENAVKTVKTKVLPTFPADTSDAKMVQKAISWATSGYFNSSAGHVDRKHTILERNNEPIKNVKVLSLEQRGNNGRAYKALIDNFYVDLREDVLMDTLLQVGVEPGGILKGNYIWAKIGSNMKLVRVDSELHKLILEFESKKQLKAIKKNDLEVGGIYQDSKKNRAVFLGFVNGTTYSIDDPKPIFSKNTAEFEYTKTPFKKLMLFFNIYNHENLTKTLHLLNQEGENFRCQLKRTHTFIEKIDQIVVPSDIISFHRADAAKIVKQKILEYTGHVAPKKGYGKITAPFLEYIIAQHSNMLNLYPYNEKSPELFDIKKYLIFS